MKRVILTMVAGVLVCSWSGATPAAQTRGGGAQPVSDAMRSSWTSAKKNIRDTAEAVPEALYAYSPVPKTVRTIGQIIGHVAGANYVFCSAAKGEKSPKAEDAFEALATKTAIVKAWDESVAYCDSAFTALTDRTAAEAIDQPFGQGKGPRAAALLGNIGHLNEHYGNLVTYMRMNNIVPPSSRR